MCPVHNTTRSPTFLAEVSQATFTEPLWTKLCIRPRLEKIVCNSGYKAEDTNPATA